MKLILIEPRGFCAGVIRAIKTVEEALSRYGAPIYVKHEIVHNAHVVKRLKDLGAIFVEDVKLVPPGSRLIYSAHGVSPEVRQEAALQGLIEIDATCGLVTKVHSAVRRYAQRGYHIVLLGHRSHVEIIGILGEAPHCCWVIESVAEVDQLNFSPEQPLFYITQTTLSLYDVEAIVLALKARYPHIETLPSSSICYATTNRQEALIQVAPLCDVIFIIGDRTSSNSNRLVEVARASQVRAYLVHDYEEIDEEWLEGVNVIGLSAGASTPEEVVQACIARLQRLGVTSIEKIIHTQEDVVFQLPRQLTG